MRGVVFVAGSAASVSMEEVCIVFFFAIFASAGAIIEASVFGLLALTAVTGAEFCEKDLRGVASVFDFME